MSRNWPIGIIVVITVMLGAAVASTLALAGKTRGAERIVVASGDDRLPNQTPADWATYADYVVVATPVGEREDAPNLSEVEGDSGLILRDVTMRVDEVLWSRPGASVAAPRKFMWKADGWVFRNGDLSDRVKMVGEDQPRIELGHTYIMAIQWQQARCTPGDYVPAQWRGLGADSTLPYDAGVIGQGELEGRSQSVEQARDRMQPADTSLEDQLLGRNAAALRQTLLNAQPIPPSEQQQFGPPPDTTKCG